MVNIYEFERSFDKRIMQQASEMIMRGDVLDISEDEPQIYSAKIKNLHRELPEVIVSIEVDKEGDVVYSYCDCNAVKPCVHMAATLMGLELIESKGCDDINSAVTKALAQE